MKKRIELLAGLVDEDNLEEARLEVVESYEKQMDDDVELFSENVTVVEEDEYRMNKLLSFDGEVDNGYKNLKTNILKENAYVAPKGEYGIAHGHGLGPGFQAWDNSSKAPYNPYKTSISEKWYLQNENLQESDMMVSDPSTLDDEQLISDYETIKDVNDADYGQRLIIRAYEDELLKRGLFAKAHWSSWSNANKKGSSGEIYDDMPPEDDPRWIKKEDLSEEEEMSRQDRIRSNLAKTNKILDKTEKRSSEHKKDERLNPGDEYYVGYGLGAGPGFVSFNQKWSLHEEKQPKLMPEHVQGKVSEYTLIGNDGEYDVYFPGKSENIRIGVKENNEGYYAFALLITESELSGHAEGKGNTIEEALDSALSQINEIVDNILPFEAIDAMMDLRDGTDIILNNNTILREDLMRMRMVGVNENGLVLTRKGSKYLTKVIDGFKMLNEAHEGETPGNAWFYTRTGTTDGSHLRFREDPYGDDPPKMHADQSEQPSSEGHPGLSGWKFYENSPEYIKMSSKRKDPLDLDMTKGSEEAYKKFWERYSVYGDSKKS